MKRQKRKIIFFFPRYKKFRLRVEERTHGKIYTKKKKNKIKLKINDDAFAIFIHHLFYIDFSKQNFPINFSFLFKYLLTKFAGNNISSDFVVFFM